MTILLNTHKQRQNFKAGFNLIEAAIVLAVVATVIGGIWGVTSSVRSAQKLNQEIQGISYFVTQVRSLYKGFDSYETVPRSMFQILPDGWSAYTGTTNDFLSPMGYKVRINTWGNGTAITVSFYSVPPSYCNQLLPRIYSFADFYQFYNQTSSFTDNVPTNRGINNYCPDPLTTFLLNFKM